MATISVTPVYRSREEKLKAPGKLAATMLEVLAAGAADGARFQRGRAYARDGAVAVLHIATGSVEAEVMGSRDGAYEVTIHTVLASGIPEEGSAASLLPLVPESDDLRFSCTCPDVQEPCKHAVAALLAFAAEVGDRPELLRIWRVGATPRARLGVAKDRPTRRAERAPDPAVPPWEQPAWQAYLGTASDSPGPADVRELLPPLPPEVPRHVGNVDVAQLVDSARAALARHVELLRELRRH